MVHVLSPGDARVGGIVATLLERVNVDDAGVQLLVLVTGGEVAAWLANGVNAGRSRGEPLLVAVTNPARGARRLAQGVRALVATPADALALVRGSALKLDALRAVAVVDANDLLAASHDDLTSLISEVPKECARVVVARESDETLDAFIEATMRRARRLTHDVVPSSNAPLQYAVVSDAQRASVLGRVLDAFDPPRATIVAEGDAGQAAERALLTLGYGEGDESVRVSDGSDLSKHEPLVVLLGAPRNATALQLVTSAQPAATVALIGAGDVTEFLRLTSGGAKPLVLSAAPNTARSADERLRDELRSVLSSRTLHREVLALEPLFAEFDAAEVAGAALRLLDAERGRAQQKRAATKPADRRAEGPAVSAPQERVAPAGTTFARLFINVGDRDGAKKGDFVGAITNEAGVSGEQIGQIDLRDSHTIVEVDASVAEQVIEKLSGSTIRGRHVIARADREPGAREGGERGDRGDRGDRPPRGAPRGGRSFGDRGREERGGFRGGARGGFGGPPRERREFDGPPRERSGFGGPPRERGGFRGREGGRDGERSGGGFRGGERGGERGGFRGPPRRRDDEGGAPRRSFDRGSDRGAGRSFGRDAGGDRPRRPFDRDERRGPRAMDESREWGGGDRGDRLRNARRNRRED